MTRASDVLVLCILAFLHLIIPPTYGKPFFDSTVFDAGYLGAYPYETFHSTDLAAPRLNVLKWDEQCDDAYILFTPRAGSVPNEGPVILNAKGDLIWTESKYGTVDNLQIHAYNGKRYITFWAGSHDKTRWPGKYYMLDSAYDVKHVITPVGYEFGDLHEFKILEGGTALMTVIDTRPWDLSPMGGPVEGWLQDDLIQEVDIETGELIFEWRASDHYEPNETYRPREGTGTSEEHGLDWIHINSIEKDERGNYFISGRTTCEIAYIDGKDGSIIWKLGGRNSSFEDLSGGTASNFCFQHDMRYHGHDEEDPKGNSILISIFDNARFRWYTPTSPCSRGLLVSLNVEEMTATLVQAFQNPLQTLAISQGNMQVLRSANNTARQSNVFIGWGHSGGWTTFDSAGQALCDVHYAAYATWNLGWAQSYRVLQYNLEAWVGHPSARPDIAAGLTAGDSTAIYASWNGATVVKAWRLQGADTASGNDDDDWLDVDEQPKDGFEVSFAISPVALHLEHVRSLRRQERHHEIRYRYYRVLAVGHDGEVLAATLPVNLETKEIINPELEHDRASVTDATVLPLLFMLAASSVIVSACMFYLDMRRASRIDIRDSGEKLNG